MISQYSCGNRNVSFKWSNRRYWICLWYLDALLCCGELNNWFVLFQIFDSILSRSNYLLHFGRICHWEGTLFCNFKKASNALNWLFLGYVSGSLISYILVAYNLVNDLILPLLEQAFNIKSDAAIR